MTYQSKICKIIVSNISFFVMVISSAALLFATVLAKKNMGVSGFYFWSVFLTIVSISFTFCYLGSEQILLRFSLVKEGVLFLPNKILTVLFVSNVVYTCLFVFVVDGFFFDIDSKFTFVNVSINVAVSVVAYNVFRLIKHFNMAQVANNLWKVLALVVVLFFSDYYMLAMNLTLIFSSLLCLMLIVKNRNKIVFVSTELKSDWKGLYGGFLFALLSVLLINNVDRFIVDAQFGNDEFSNYIYFMSIVILPFSLLSSYFGFREVPALKDKYRKDEFNKKLLNVVLFVSFSYFSLMSAVFFLNDYLGLYLTLEIVFVSYLIVIVKCLYSLFSALFGLRATTKQMIISNTITMLAVLLSTVVVLYLGVSVVNILLLMCWLWSVRLAVYFYYTREIKEY